MKKQILTATVLSVLLVSTIANANKSQAFMGFFEDNNSNLVDSLVSKFNLKKDDVVTFFNQRREQNQSERLNQMQTKLDQLVANNKLTSTQKNEWLSLIKKHQQQLRDVNVQNREEMQKLRESHRQEMQNFAQKNNLDLSLLQMGRGQKNMQRAK